MKFLTIAFSFLVIAMSVSVASAQDRTVEILNTIDDMWRADSSHSVITMKVKTAHYERTLKMEAWSKGKEKSLIRILSPLKEKGTSTLKSGKHLYTYLPKTDRTIRLTSGMMTGSWMGSHFTNDDLVKEARFADDFTYKVTFEGVKEGVDIIEITCTPKEDAAVTWGKVVIWARSDGYQPVKQIFYDEDMAVARTMIFSNITKFGERSVPATMRVVPADKPTEFTEIIYEKMDFGVSLKESMFSKSNLKRN